MDVSRNDLLYGARSGIQKAIRRGDLDLAKTCFDLLWSDTGHRNWLRWRIYSLVAEEAYHLSGELTKLLAEETVKEDQWRRFIYLLTLSTKSKDAVGLWWAVTRYPEAIPVDVYNIPEITLAQYYCSRLEKYEFSAVAQEVYGNCKDEVTTDYEQKALQILHRRSQMGGMMGDRYVCLSSMILVATRGLSEPEILSDLKKGPARWTKKAGNRKPKTIQLPWYVFDMHTKAGQVAMGIFMRHHAKKYGFTEETFKEVWFWEESNRMDLSSMNVKETTEPTCLDSIYYLPVLRSSLGLVPTYTAKQMHSTWGKSIQRDIEGCVRWILEKRNERQE